MSFLRDLLRPSLAFVRPLHRYYVDHETQTAVLLIRIRPAVILRLWSRLPAGVHVGLIAHRFLPPIHSSSAMDDNRVTRFSCVKFPYMHGVFDSAVPTAHSDTLRAAVLHSGCPDTVGASDFGYFGAHNFGIPSLHVPLSNASSAPLPTPSHGRGQDSSLLLSCMTLSYFTQGLSRRDPGPKP